MPLTWRAKPFEMRFCLACHRDPASRLGPRDQVTRMAPLGWSAETQRRFGIAAVKAHHIDPVRLANCETCHR
jgi:hypothetical protein